MHAARRRLRARRRRALAGVDDLAAAYAREVGAVVQIVAADGETLWHGSGFFVHEDEGVRLVRPRATPRRPPRRASS